MENLKNYLFELCSEFAPSGREELLLSLERLAAPLADKVYRDSVGNFVAVKYCGIPGAKKIMLDAHADEVGLLVTHIDDKGFIHFHNHTGVDDRILPSATVTVLGTRALTGVIATLPPHLLKNTDTTVVVPKNEMIIDVGYDAETVRRLVKTGDLVTLRGGCADLLNNLVMGKSFDNRASCAVLLSVLSTFKKIKPRADIYFVFSAAEEFSGGYGAKTAAFDIVPDEAVVLDVTFGISPFTKAPKGKKLGDGVAIGKSPILDSHMTDELVSKAASHAIPYQLEIMNGRTGTNADKIITTRTGVPTALLSIPLRYMHSAGEVVSLDDMKSTARLLISFTEYKGGVINE